MIENHNVAGIGLHGNAAGKLRGRDAEKFERVVDIDLPRPNEVVGLVAAGNETQRPGAAGEGVQIERNLGGEELPPSPVGVPAGVAAVIVAVASAVVEIVSQNASDEVEYHGVIEQRAHVGSVFDRFKEHGAARAVVVSSAAAVPDCPFKFIDDFVCFIGWKQLRNHHVAEGVEEVELFLGQRHF